MVRVPIVARSECDRGVDEWQPCRLEEELVIKRVSPVLVGLSVVGSLLMVATHVVAATPAAPSFTIAAD